MAPYVLANRTSASFYPRSLPTHPRLPRHSLRSFVYPFPGRAVNGLNLFTGKTDSKDSKPPYLGVGPVLLHPSPTSLLNTLSSTSSSPSSAPHFSTTRLGLVAIILIPAIVLGAIILFRRRRYGKQRPAQKNHVSPMNQGSVEPSSHPQAQGTRSCPESAQSQLPRDRIRAMNSVPSNQLSLTADKSTHLSSPMHQESTPLFFSTLPSTPMSPCTLGNYSAGINTSDPEPLSPLSLPSPSIGFSDNLSCPSTPVTPTTPVMFFLPTTPNSSFLSSSFESSGNYENPASRPQEISGSEIRYTWDFKCQGIHYKKENCLDIVCEQPILDISGTSNYTFSGTPVITSDAMVSKKVPITDVNERHEYTGTIPALVPARPIMPIEDKNEDPIDDRVIPLSITELESVVGNDTDKDKDNDTTLNTTCATLVADVGNEMGDLHAHFADVSKDNTCLDNDKFIKDTMLLLPDFELVAPRLSFDFADESHGLTKSVTSENGQTKETSLFSPSKCLKSTSTEKLAFLSTPSHRTLSPRTSNLKTSSNLPAEPANAMSPTSSSFLNTNTAGILTSAPQPKLASMQFGSTRSRSSRGRAASTSETVIRTKASDRHSCGLSINISKPASSRVVVVTDSGFDSCLPLVTSSGLTGTKGSEVDCNIGSIKGSRESKGFLRSSFSLPISVELASLCSVSRRLKSKCD